MHGQKNIKLFNSTLTICRILNVSAAFAENEILIAFLLHIRILLLSLLLLLLLFIARFYSLNLALRFTADIPCRSLYYHSRYSSES